MSITEPAEPRWKQAFITASIDRQIYENALRRISDMLPTGGAGDVARKALKDCEAPKRREYIKGLPHRYPSGS